MSPFLESKKKSYQMHRAVSQGAGITLVYIGNEYRATFDCANKIAGLLGQQGLQDMGDEFIESIPYYDIASADMQKSIMKICKELSVAIVEYAADAQGGRFVCTWKVPVVEERFYKEAPSNNVEDY